MDAYKLDILGIMGNLGMVQLLDKVLVQDMEEELGSQLQDSLLQDMVLVQDRWDKLLGLGTLDNQGTLFEVGNLLLDILGIPFILDRLDNQPLGIQDTLFELGNQLIDSHQERGK